HSHMPLISTKQLVGTLADKRYLDILSCALRDKVHGDNRRRGNGFLQTFDNLGQRLLELVAIKFYGHMPCAEHCRGFCSVRQLIISEGFSVTDRVRRPRPALLIDQRKKQPGVETTAKKYPYRHIAQQVATDCDLVQFQKFAFN